MQTKINVHIHSSEIKQNGKTRDGYSYDTLRIKHTSGRRVYYTWMKNEIPMQEVVKVMQLNEGKVYLSFGKKKIEIGTYEKVAVWLNTL